MKNVLENEANIEEIQINQDEKLDEFQNTNEIYQPKNEETQQDQKEEKKMESNEETNKPKKKKKAKKNKKNKN